MVGVFGDLLGGLVQHGDLRARFENTVTAVASACGMDAKKERERFLWCWSSLNYEPRKVCPNDQPGNLMALVGGQPPEFELVLSHGRAAGFGYLTAGLVCATLNQSLAGLLRGALQMLVEQETPDAAQRLAGLFRLAFPGLETLGHYSPAAQAMILGVMPAGEKTALKTYFNTRLDTTTPHRDRVLRLLQAAGVDDQGIYDVLYEQQTGEVFFHGVGVDLDAQRAKLYIHAPRSQVESIVQRVSEHLGFAASAAIEPAKGMLSVVESDALIDEVEIAVALSADNPSTIKVTGFFSRNRIDNDTAEQVTSYLRMCGHPLDPLAMAIETLSAGVTEPTHQVHPLHAVGLETPVGDRPKINIYLKPVT